MTPERWERIKEIFRDALEKPAAERSSFLGKACGGDAEMRDEVERLLAKEDAPSLASPAGDLLNHAAAELSPGEMLAQYRIEAKLGEGGMGAVYRAYDTRLRRQVAVKVLLPDSFSDPEHKPRLLGEARAASALNHPNIVTIHEIGAERGQNFIAMEYVEGRPLSKVIPSKGLPVAKALDYAVQIADALAQAHAAGVVHRDLKPANVMVTGAGRVKLLDFGLARRVRLPEGETGTLSVQGEIAGTPAYMSPEQAEGKKTDERTDVFAFGAVLYEMLSGRRAFQGDTTLAVLGAVLKEEPKPLTGVPRELARIVELCLKKDPAHRLQHIDDVKILFETVCVTEAAATTRKPRRRPILAGLASLLAVVVVAGSLRLWMNRHPGAEVTPEVTRLTSDPGLTFQPAISADGKMLAYSSDRGGQGNLDIWVQHMGGGDPIQITTDSADDSKPSFSPDGSQIAFRSERDGGGVYVIAALGGEARLIAPGGRDPRFSQDGSQIAYWVGWSGQRFTALGNSAIYVVPSRGGPPRRLQKDFLAASAPIWSPDGRHILFGGCWKNRADADWWVTPAEGGTAIGTGARDFLRRRKTHVAYQDPPGAWTGSHLIFSLGYGDTSNLWQIPISTKNWEVSGEPQRLTFGTAMNIQPSVSSSGEVTFANLNVNLNLWSLAIDPLRGKVTGTLQRLTRQAGSHRHPTVSPDGKKVSFTASGRSGAQLRIKDLATGKEVPLTGIPPQPYYSTFASDSSRVAFTGFEDGKTGLYIVPAGGGVAERICEGDVNAPAWSSDGSKVVYDTQAKRRRQVVLLELATGKTLEILKHADCDVLQPQFCPGDRWISFARVTQPGRTRVTVAPFRGAAAIPESEWIPVTDGAGFDSRPRWSPDGNLLYFVSDRDGYRCIWAQRLEPGTKRPVGAAFNVRHFHAPGLALGDIPSLGWGVARDKIVFNMIERTGNIWTFKLPD